MAGARAAFAILLFVAGVAQVRPDGDSSVLARLPMQVLANAPYVDATMNGRGPFTFEIDTGSMNSPLARELAEEMGFDPRPAVRTGQAVAVSLGAVALPIRASFASFANLWGLPGRRVYGDIGFNALKNLVVELDYARRTFLVHDPARFVYHGRGAVFPATLEAGYDPQIEGELRVSGLPPIRTRFTLDTGAGGTVISAPIVDRYRLADHASGIVPQPHSAPLADGVNGAVFETVTARIEGIRLGPYAIERPLVALSRDTQGWFAGETVGVNLGGNVLRRFTVIVDYPNTRVILEPNEHIEDPFLSDASGLVLTTGDGDFHTFVLHGVVPESPAAAAGCREGDVIVAINGEPAARYALWQVQDLLREAPRTRRLTIRRGDATVTLEIRLRPLA
jgi:PDZ domain-containing protein